MGSDVLLQPSTLQADNHKKRTGFGPQQASFGVYVSNAFGGMSGALKLWIRVCPILALQSALLRSAQKSDLINTSYDKNSAC